MCPKPPAQTPAQQSIPSRPRLRLISWNILNGGEHGRDAIAAILAAARADVIVTIETYGAGRTISDALGDEFDAVKITDAEPGDGDNLWLFSRLPIIERFPAPQTESISSFHAGGVRLLGPANQEIDVFGVWLHYLDDLVEPIEQHLQRPDREPREPPAVLSSADDIRLEQIRSLLAEYVADHSSVDRPTILAGDFNTLSHLDWNAPRETDGQRHLPGLPCPVTREVAAAGFIDCYRAVRPDIAADPGGTWSTERQMFGTYRIDYVHIRGDLEPAGAWLLGERAAGDPALDFFSDHAALLVDLWCGR